MSEYFYNGKKLNSLKTNDWEGNLTIKFSLENGYYDFYMNDNTAVLLTEQKPHSHDNTTSLKIIDLPILGFGTFIFNSWLVIAKTFFENDTKITGTIHHPDDSNQNDIDNRNRFWSQFGFNINNTSMHATLGNLHPVEHRDGGEYFIHPFEFNDINGVNLYCTGLLHKFRTRR